MAVSASGGLSLSDGTLSGVGPQVDVYNYSGSSSTYTTTWTKPSWATTVHIWCVGGGQGGQGGNKGPSSITNNSAAGSSASIAEGFYDASALPSSLTVSIGKGASGGSGATADNSSGSLSGAVNASSVGTADCTSTTCLVWASGGYLSTAMWLGVNGGSSISPGTAQTCTLYASYAPGVGAPGGGIIAGLEAGNIAGASGCMSPSSGGSGGTVGSNRNGGNGTSYTSGRRVGGGGGCGMASVSLGVSGGNGGNGGSPGGGGGGGGAGLNATSNGGAGGAGGNGICVIVSY